MQIIIDIPEKTYKATRDGCMLPPDVENVVQGIKNGIPLQKRHGKIIDEGQRGDKMDNCKIEMRKESSEQSNEYELAKAFTLGTAFGFAKKYDEMDAIMEAIKVLEPYPRWIPCSERLPEDNGWYQCTVISDNLSQIMDLFYKSGKWLDNRRIDMYNIYDIYGYGFIPEKHKLSYQELISDFDWTKNVVAWMPLPQSYKPKDSGK